MFYETLKIIHISCALLSISGFILRGVWMLQNSPWLQSPLTKRLPHIVDTVLLLTAIAMVYWSSQYPFQQGWLTAKVVALVVYIGLGMLALRYGKSRRVRGIAWLSAIVVFMYIVGVALSRDAALFIVTSGHIPVSVS